MATVQINLEMLPKQIKFVQAHEDEVLYGGAAGGGKSYGQLIDALLYALQYKGSRQLILRRTYPELERSLILSHLSFYPREVYTYKSGSHRGQFANGSIIEFGYCDAERDVYRYQSAEYDVIRFDELTHFTQTMYTYLTSRLRGANPYPKQIKSTTNPGGVGHSWVKARFIDPVPPGQRISSDNGTRIFIPALVTDNAFLMEADPGYIKRLEALTDNDKRALLHGEWDIFDGQFFAEWSAGDHVAEPFAIPGNWARYFALDYGLDMLAGYWIAVDFFGRAYVYREVYQSGLIISEAAKLINEMTSEAISAHFAPADIWNRRQDTGKSAADIFSEAGIYLQKSSNDRVQGWLNLKEWLALREGEDGKPRPRLVIFNNCRNLIRCLPAVMCDPRNPCDVSKEPHELTHAPDALRYFASAIAPAPVLPKSRDDDYVTEDEQILNLLAYGG